MSNHNLVKTEITTFKRGETLILKRENFPMGKTWSINQTFFDEPELAALAYFAIQELEGLLLSVFAEHDQAASATQIQRVLDSLSWIAEELGPTPEPHNDKLDEEQQDRVKELFDRIHNE